MGGVAGHASGVDASTLMHIETEVVICFCGGVFVSGVLIWLVKEIWNA